MAVKTWFSLLALAMVVAQLIGTGMAYERPPARKMYIVLDDDDQDPTHPEQVHISMVGADNMRITWVTKDETPAEVHYGTAQGQLGSSATGSTRSYKYVIYTSGTIHDVVIGPLNANTVYYYRCGSSGPEFRFKTPPSQFPIRIAVAGDFGQTEWTKSTLDHISKSNYDLLLLAGDLSYADFYQPLWDSFGRLVEPLASQRPWMTATGNHDVEKIIVVHPEKCTSYNARWHMPFEESGSTSNLYYSFEVAGVHVVVLGSYTDFGSDSDQYKWLQADLGKVDRKRTPWLVVMLHAPWYNSNSAHQGEEESDGMRDSIEEMLYKARVDVVFAGHVHAYERFDRVYQGKTDECGPVYITIGDGGNREGLATKYIDPKPDISLFREASFGHGQLNVVDGNTMEWTWHRNDDDQSVASDSVTLKSLATEPGCN
ncbi:putative purple acid phosphatase 20 [Vitis vinifera]|uniref:Purple acid phosphatase n=1 Tax=Vitis vinifera TaxID=29760 RepID=A0A438JRW9_VITVI|nr:putative purple acid phosphatase 20 [Vitis vinifera]